MSTSTQIRFRYKRPRHFRSHESAWRAGTWALAAFYGDQRAVRTCREQGIELRTEGNDTAVFGYRTAQQDENVGSQGAYLVPDDLAEAIVTIREEYGITAADARVQPMRSDSTMIPRRPYGSGVTASYVNNNVALSTTNLAFDGLRVTVRKIIALVLMSSEFSEDSVIELADLFADEFGWAFAKAEDAACFTGDGTSTYGGQVGACLLFSGNTSKAGLFTAAAGHTTFATLTANDFTSTMGLLPAAYQPTARWYLSPACYSDACLRLSAASGFNTANNVEGILGPSFAQHLARLAPAMASSTGSEVNQIAALYGDLSKSVVIARRRQMTVRMSDERFLEYDQVALLGSERFCVNVHGTGDNTNPGALVALMMPSS